MFIGTTSVCFVNCHLAANAEKVRFQYGQDDNVDDDDDEEEEDEEE